MRVQRRLSIIELGAIIANVGLLAAIVLVLTSL
jgi:hypothetical protein